jgi:hypothetical protein
LKGQRHQNQKFDKINKLWEKDKVASICAQQVQATSIFPALTLFLLGIEEKTNKGHLLGSKRMKKSFILFLAFCFLTCLGGCKGKKQGEGKPGTSHAEKNEKKTVAPPAPNYAPKVVGAKIVPDPAYANRDLKVEVNAEDPEKDLIELKYQWIKFMGEGPVRTAVNLEGETDPTLSHDKFVHGDVVAVRITPFDWKGAEGQMYQTKLLVIRNSPPEIISLPPENISGPLFTYPVKVKDMDNDPITLSLCESVPKGMTINPTTGLITWAIPPGVTGTFSVTVNGDDGHGGTCYQKLNLTLTAPPKPKEGKE